MAGVFRAYNAALLRRPMLTQCVTAAALFGAGDVIAQQAIEKKGFKKHDLMRTARLTFYGGAIFGPILTKWYDVLNRLRFSTPLKALVYRVYLDQFILTPGAVAFFFGCMTLLEGKDLKEAEQRISDNYVSTLIRNWGVFIPAQIANFSIVPPQFRFGFVSVVSLFWNTYLSWANAQAQERAALAKVEEVEEKVAEKLPDA